MANGTEGEKFMVVLGPDSKPDSVLTMIRGFQQLAAMIDNAKTEILLALDKAISKATLQSPAGEEALEELEEGSKQFQEDLEDDRPKHEPKKPATQGGDTKEFWYKDEDGNHAVKMDMQNPVCPLCDLQMGEPREDNYGKPSLYCKECRMYFNWSKYNDQSRRPAGGGRAPGRSRYPARKGKYQQW